ncbi:MAG: trigger factor [Bacteroidetes bacterium]|nr:trigger factor [Bacteroidota bacterium]
MNITRENIDALNAVIRINITPEDYKPRVDSVIRKYQKTANVPGFRPGMVPAGMIRKMYGKSLLVDELNTLLSETLGKYIYDNKIDVIGNPLPKKSEKEQVFEDGENFEFLYELGIAPEFEITFPKSKIPYYQVKIDEQMVDNDLGDLRRRYGKFSNPEVSEETNILYGEFNELDPDGNLMEGGNKTTTTLSVEMIKEVHDRKPFIGLKKNDTVDFNPMNVLKNEAEVAAMLRVDKISPALLSNYRFTVMTINQVEKAELNQEFFDKIYGEGVVKTEEEFRAKIREGIASYFGRESDRKLKKDLRLKMLEELQVPLPDDFLKRMLIANQEKGKELDASAFEHEYFHLSDDLRWNLINGKIAKTNSLDISEEEVVVVAKQVLHQQFANYGMYDLDAAKLDDLSKRYLAEENNREKIERTILDQKVFDFVKPQLKLDIQEFPYEKFIEKIAEKTEHELEHHH